MPDELFSMNATASEAAVVRVALVPPQGRTPVLDYRLPSGAAPESPIGARVVVPLGHRRATGVVIETPDGAARGDLREVVAVMDRVPVLDATLVRLCRWMSDYYLVPIGEALAAALPGGLRCKIERLVRVVAPAGRALRPGEERVWREIEAAGGAVSLARLRASAAGIDVARIVKRLEQDGAVRIEESLAREAGPTRLERRAGAARVLTEEEAGALRRKRPALYDLYARLRAAGDQAVPLAALRASVPGLTPKLRALVGLGLARVESAEIYRPVPHAAAAAAAPPAPTPEQEAAAAAIAAGIEARAFTPLLLLGVTGSGKTEVYLRSIDAVLRAGRGALVLVPEISLTHQLVDRLRGRFGAAVAVLHSAMSPGERWDAWRRLARGEARLAVGARSAVFAPVRHLGLIVVDEEHDGAYKQEDGVRYHARDCAVMRAKLTGCPAVLGSATPSMESFDNARRGRYGLLELTERVEGRPLPEVEVVDLRRRVARVEKGVPLSPELVAGLRANHTARGQSLVFLNRRGFANFLQCGLCGATRMCPNCSVALTLHLRWRSLRCHHCDFTARQPALCPECGEPGLQAWGAGTEQVEKLMASLVPGARVARMDRDTTARRGAQRAILEAWEGRRFDVLVGTQMITKGHDIPGVTFVGVLLADQSLNFPDFRAAERTFQLLTQVAGRAGRGGRAGRVVVQTFQPRHYSLTCAAAHDFRRFAADELEQRRAAGYPPFSRLVLIRCEGESAVHAEAAARRAAEHVREVHSSVQVLGPAPAPLERLRGRFHWQLLLRARNGTAVRRAAASAGDAVRDGARRQGVRLIVDVDPYSML